MTVYTVAMKKRRRGLLPTPSVRRGVSGLGDAACRAHTAVALSKLRRQYREQVRFTAATRRVTFLLWLGVMFITGAGAVFDIAPAVAADPAITGPKSSPEINSMLHFLAVCLSAYFIKCVVDSSLQVGTLCLKRRYERARRTQNLATRNRNV